MGTFWAEWPPIHLPPDQWAAVNAEPKDRHRILPGTVMTETVPVEEGTTQVQWSLTRHQDEDGKQWLDLYLSLDDFDDATLSHQLLEFALYDLDLGGGGLDIHLRFPLPDIQHVDLDDDPGPDSTP